MTSTKDFKPLWPGKDYVVPMPNMAGDHGGTKGGYDVGGSAAKETQDLLGQKVTTVEVSGGAASKGDKITDSTFSAQIATPNVRKPTKKMG